jgi:hypothetical protein
LEAPRNVSPCALCHAGLDSIRTRLAATAPTPTARRSIVAGSGTAGIRLGLFA